MIYRVLLCTLLSALLLISCNQRKLKYPEAKKSDTSDNYFGTDVPDPYRWLEDENSNETKQWVAAENIVTFDYLSKIPFRYKIKEKLTELWNFEKRSLLMKKGGYYFFYKNDGLQNQDILYIMDNLLSEPKPILDPNQFSSDGSSSLSDFNVSKDGKYLAYSISAAGSDINMILIKEIKSGKLLNDTLKGVKFSEIAWYKNGIFYSRFDDLKSKTDLSKINQYHKVYYHKAGTDQESDELIFENKDFPQRNYIAYLTSDEKYLIVSETETTDGNSIYIKNLEKKKKDFTKLTTSFEYEYQVIDHINDNLIILTNYRAPKYKLININVNSLDIGNWRDIIPEKSEVLEFCRLVGDKILAGYLKDAHSKLEVYNQQGNFISELMLPGIGSIEDIDGTKNDPVGFFSFTSFTNPVSIYKYDSKSNTIELNFKPKLNVNTDNFETRQIFYKSKDGMKIPMFIVSKKGIKLDGKNPALLYGYGGFNISITPQFSISRLLWLEMGGIYASANIRGGGEYGENWHLAGKGFNKQNVFDDFIYAAQYLIDEKYTSPDYLAIQGGSNGGLLIGAVVNQRPELFKVAIPAVGVMDMLRFHKFTIGGFWVDEYGSSNDSAQFVNLIRYSPLHTINGKLHYPAILVTTADHDDRVVPAHSFKYIATLQEKYFGSNPVLIRIQTNAGHGKGKPTQMKIAETADIYSFILYNMKVSPGFNINK